MIKVIGSLIWANLIHRPLTSILTIGTLAIAIAVLSVLLQFQEVVDKRIARDVAGVDLVVGAKGSPLQLVMSSLLHVDIPTGNIDLKDAQDIMRDPRVAKAIPLALGDSFRGFRLVGTTHEFPALYGASLAEGEMWENPEGVVIGASVHERLGMNLGQTFYSSHGMGADGTNASEHDHAPLTVVGILEPTDSVIDRLIITSVDTTWISHGLEQHEEDGHEHEEDGHEHEEDGHEHEEGGHEHEEDGHEHEEDGHEHEEDGHEHQEDGDDHDHEHNEGLFDLKTMDPEGLEVTALLIKYRSPIAAVSMPRAINDMTGMQAASPAMEVTRLFSLTSGVSSAFQAVGIILVLMGGLGVFAMVSTNSVSRLYDMALLRAIGARPRMIFMQQIGEGVLLALIGGIIGICLGHLMVYVLGEIWPVVRETGLDGSSISTAELLMVPGAALTGFLASLWPAYKASSTDPLMLLQGGR